MGKSFWCHYPHRIWRFYIEKQRKVNDFCSHERGLILFAMNRMNTGSASLILLALLSFTFISSSCRRAAPKIDPVAYAREIDQWHQKRYDDLKSETGWLTLVGLFWLKEGENKFGSDAANDIALPNKLLSAHAGSFAMRSGVVRLDASQSGFSVDGKPVQSLELKTDEDAKPTIVRLGSLSFQIIKRGDRLGVRGKELA